MYDMKEEIQKTDGWIRQRRKRHAPPVAIFIVGINGTKELPSETKDDIASSLFDCALRGDELASIHYRRNYIELIFDGPTGYPIDADFVEKVLSWCD